MNTKLNCVLLIDDDWMSNLFHKIIIDDAEIASTIVREYSGNSALTYLSDSVSTKGHLPFPDLVFLDLNMPDGNGWDFITRYNAEKDRFPKAPVIIMLTSYHEPHNISKAKATSEITAFHPKPLTQQNLETIITTYFPSSFKGSSSFIDW